MLEPGSCKMGLFVQPDPVLQMRAQAAVELRRRQSQAPPVWAPNPDHENGRPNPQRLAYESPADVLGYGGSAGSGKSSLLLGLAATRHRRSAIFRRVYPNLRGLIDESKELLGRVGTFNEVSTRWTTFDGRVIEFESCQYERDKEKQRGRPRDFYGFDEATEFSASQILFISAWMRSTDPDQRCRIVMTFNPPTDRQGSWVVEFFKPWFAYLFPKTFFHPKPAAPGELRWYAVVDGEEVELDSGTPFSHKGELLIPLSRTFIPGRLADNPHLRDSNYASVLQSLPEPLRSQLLYGDFSAKEGADPFQIIPTEWVQAAQARYRESPPILDGRIPTSVGVDVARGGRDRTVLAPRWGDTYGEPILYPGTETIDGPTVAGLLQKAFPQASMVNVDVIGVGSSAYDSLAAMYPSVTPVMVSEGSKYTDRSGRLKMRNLRAELIWRMRDMLDPTSGRSIALPPGPEVLADLCAPRYRVLAGGGVLAESKEDVQARLGRSPDVGDAILLASYEPPTESRASWLDLVEDLRLDDVRSFWE